MTGIGQGDVMASLNQIANILQKKNSATMCENMQVKNKYEVN